jgi:chaperone protein EcpD
MNILFPTMRTVILGALLVFSCYSHAAVTLGGTRLIFTAPNKETSILAKNNSSQDIMIQSWIDPDESAQNQDTPFAITPSLNRLGGNKQQLLRIFYQGKGADEKRESVYWLSVQEIPPKPDQENILQIAVRQKIKVFYRPAGLVGSAEEAPKELQWRLTSQGVEVTNPSAFHVSIAKAKLTAGGTKYLINADMVKPESTITFSIKGWKGASSSASAVEFEVVNDYGGVDQFTSATK